MIESIDQTIDFYNRNSQDFAKDTVAVDFRAAQNRFLEKLRPGARILDFGCGSGRDSKYFHELGFQVTPLDGSEELCKLTSDYVGIPVRQMLFQDLEDVEEYDGIWACASLLHISLEELPDVMVRLVRALKENGVIYLSFEYGDFHGMRNEHYFTDMTETSFATLLEKVEGICVEETWVSTDVRQGRENETWLNLFLRKPI